MSRRVCLLLVVAALLWVLGLIVTAPVPCVAPYCPDFVEEP